MRVAMVLWVNSQKGFLRDFPLLESLERYVLLHGEATNLDLLFCYGIEELPDLYVDKVKALGANVYDCSKLYTEITSEFERIQTLFYQVFTPCFLRWIIIKRFYQGEFPICAIDGDIVLNSRLVQPPEWRGQTFAATSTYFVHISDSQWLDVFETELTSLERLGMDYLHDNMTHGGTKLSFDEYRTSPEEYFVANLIYSGRLRQDYTDAVRMPFNLIPCPQYLPKMFALNYTGNYDFWLNTPMSYERLNGVDFISEKPVFVWHFQKPFLKMASAALAIEQIVGSERRHLGKIEIWNQYGIVPGHLRDIRFAKLLRFLELNAERTFDPTSDPFDVRNVYAHFFCNGDLSSLFNNNTWHIDNVWESGLAA